MHSLSACCEASLHCELLKVSFKQFGQTHRLIKRTKKRVTFVNFCALRKIGKFGFWIKGTSNLCRFETKARRIKLKKSALFQSRFRGLNQRDTIFELAIQFFLSVLTRKFPHQINIFLRPQLFGSSPYYLITSSKEKFHAILFCLVFFLFCRHFEEVFF